MDPQDFNRILDELASRPTAELESFFMAQGLGTAFAAPSKGWGRRKRVNEALQQADRNGTLQTVLVAAMDKFEIAPKRNSGETPRPRPQSDENAHTSKRSKLAAGRRAYLRASVDDAEVELDELRALGTRLSQNLDTVAKTSDFERVREQALAWNSRISETLKSLFSTNEVDSEFRRLGAFRDRGGTGVAPRKVYLSKDIERHVNWLDQLRARLPLFQDMRNSVPRARIRNEPSTQIGVAAKPREPDAPPSIFLVHGQDVPRKETVARFLERVTGLNVVILHEQPNRGQTIIEKFEGHARRADFAVVLLTADDLGRPAAASETDAQPRSRQNVVFELGFFVASLGRERVVVLVETDVERPSDIDGLVYIGLDGEWRSELFRELLAARLPADPTKL